MNTVCGYVWLLSAAAAAMLSFWTRSSLVSAAAVAAVVLAEQTCWAFVVMGLVQAVAGYATRAALMVDWMGPALALSVPLFWWRLLCWRRDSNTTITTT